MGAQQEDKTTIGISKNVPNHELIQAMVADGAVSREKKEIIILVQPDTYGRDFYETYQLNPGDIMGKYTKLKMQSGSSTLTGLFTHCKKACAYFDQGLEDEAKHEVFEALQVLNGIGVGHYNESIRETQILGGDTETKVRTRTLAMLFQHGVHANLAEGNESREGMGWPGLGEYFKQNPSAVHDQVVDYANKLGAPYLADVYQFTPAE